MIEYRKGSVFDAPTGSLLVHACNCQGVWGSGVARGFKDKFPRAFAVYKKEVTSSDKIGKHLLIGDNAHYIACLMTSKYYGKHKDSVEVILENTRSAISDLFCSSILRGSYSEIHSPKINAGLFGVPWGETEKIIKEVIPESFKWVVWEL